MSRRTLLSDPAFPEKPTARPRRRDQILRTAGTSLFCGQTSCPGGALTAGMVGGSLAFGLQAERKLKK